MWVISFMSRNPTQASEPSTLAIRCLLFRVYSSLAWAESCSCTPIGNHERSRAAAIPTAVGLMLYGLAMAAIWVATLLIPLSEADTSNLMAGAFVPYLLAVFLGWSVQWAINRRQ